MLALTLKRHRNSMPSGKIKLFSLSFILNLIIFNQTARFSIAYTAMVRSSNIESEYTSSVIFVEE